MNRRGFLTLSLSGVVYAGCGGGGSDFFGGIDSSQMGNINNSQNSQIGSVNGIQQNIDQNNMNINNNSQNSNLENFSSSNKLAIPEIMDAKDFDLYVQRGTKEFFSGKITQTFGVNGNFLGPTIRVKEGDNITINVHNNLGEETTMHWHGLHIPAKYDGGPHQVIKSGEVWKINFKIMQRASTNWYHPHALGKTGEQVYKGLAGLFIIEDENSLNIDLPNEYGVDDIPLVIQDRRFNSDGSFNYINSQMDIMQGVLGDVILTNGTIEAYVSVKAKKVRFRILNGSNARIYNLGFSDNRSFYQIATDGGLLENLVELNRFSLATGERAEIIVDLSGDYQKNLILKDFNSGYKILDINVDEISNQDNIIPYNLSNIIKYSEYQAVKTRSFTLDTRRMSFTINGNTMSMDRIDETIKLNDIEIWEIYNNSMMAHPFHIHDVEFLILDRDGNEPNYNERGLKDVVLVNSGERVRIIMKFDDFADDKNPYMYHCHILEHEDAGMMGQFLVK